MGKAVEDANTYRVGHPLAQRLLERARGLTLTPAEVTFCYTGTGKNIALLEPLRGKTGWLVCSRLTLSALETEDMLVLTGITDEGVVADEAECRRLFDLEPEGEQPRVRSEGSQDRRQEPVGAQHLL